MNEETTQKVITHLLDEVKRLTTERNTAIKDLENVLDMFDDVVNEYRFLYDKYNDLAGKMPNNRSKKYKPVDPYEPSFVNMFSKSEC